jgi:hypothetical protein
VLPPVIPADAPPLAARKPTASEPPRARSLSQAPVLDEIDTGWDDEPKAPATVSTPSSGELASDGAPESDQLDSVD